ncbi:MAG: flagellar biosynthesis protein FliQ [Candidatus Latescibacteria bacterium]|nr:flagellar biosynthesis protein FliQ [bacterium]MBD3424920.1 flagellar biosynthesis protein FliQ [Candidatus Latescibacterota bacterium]
MTEQMVIDLGRHTLYVAFLVASPMLLFGLAVGVLIGIFQAVTQINEMTLVFVPKILAVSLAIIIFLPWILNLLITFGNEIMARISAL